MCSRTRAATASRQAAGRASVPGMPGDLPDFHAPDLLDWRGTEAQVGDLTD